MSRSARRSAGAFRALVGFVVLDAVGEGAGAAGGFVGGAVGGVVVVGTGAGAVGGVPTGGVVVVGTGAGAGAGAVVVGVVVATVGLPTCPWSCWAVARCCFTVASPVVASCRTAAEW